MLWTLVAVTGLLYLALTLVCFVPPKLINLPVGAERRAAAIPVAFAMVGWLKAETMWIFAALIWTTIAVAQGRSQGLTVWFAPTVLVVVLGTVAFHIWQMTRRSG